MAKEQVTENQFDQSPAYVILALDSCSDCPREKKYDRGERADWPLHWLDLHLLVQQCSTFNEPPTIVLTGRDPILHPELFSLIRTCKRLGLESVLRLSSTREATPHIVRALDHAGLTRLALRLDSPDAAQHDRSVGITGAFERTLRIIHDTKTWWLPAEIHTIMSHENIGHINAMAELIDSLHVHSWWLDFLVSPEQNGLDALLSPLEFEMAFSDIWKNSLHMPYGIEVTGAPHYRRFVVEQQNAAAKKIADTPWQPIRRAKLPLNDGKGTMYITDTGVIYPGEFLKIPCGQFPANVVTDVYQNSATFLALRDPNRIHGKCGECGYGELCGGSHARAFALIGDPLGSDPGCYNVAYEPGPIT